MKQCESVINMEFEGDLNCFSDIQINFIQKVLENRGFKNGKIQVELVGQPGDNYQSHIKRIIVKENDIVFQMIAKVAPTNAFMRTMGNTAQAFANEILMYGEVFPKFKELVASKQLTRKELLRTPECYGFLDEPPNEIILIEDLRVSNLSLLDKLIPFTDESMKLALQNLAYLHSLSYILKELFPEMYSDLTKRLVNLWSLMDSGPMSAFSNQMENDVINFLDDEDYKAVIKGTVTNMPNLSKQLLDNDKDSKHGVILHGDCWTNNILFRKQDEKSLEAVLIDYQASKIGRPVVDFLYLTLICTDHATRKAHYQQWKEYYYLELDKSLQRFGLRADEFYSKDVFEEDLKTHGRFGLSLALMLTFPLLGVIPQMQNLDMPQGIESLPPDMLKVLESLGAGSPGADFTNSGAPNMANISKLLGENLPNISMENAMPPFPTPILSEDIAFKLKNKIGDCVKSALEFDLISKG